MIRDLFDSTPVLGVFAMTLLMVLLAIELGFLVGLVYNKRFGSDREAPLSAITGAHLALLAFIMGFTFNMAAGHFDARKKLVLEEANAIGTAYLRAQLVPAPEGEEIGRLLVEYSAVRAGESGTEPTRIIELSSELHSALWRQVQSLARQRSPTEFDALLVSALNDVIDVHEKRVTAHLRSRIPEMVWSIICLLLVASMIAMGFFTSMNGRRNPIATTALAVSFSIVMLMIEDLDRPDAGLLRTDQSTLLELSQRLREPLRE
ncbi:MAG: hypothetical protein ACK2TX_05570 [Anaerolineales bacterium]|jgi:uncharacterized membrane protein (DUF485 family)